MTDKRAVILAVTALRTVLRIGGLEHDTQHEIHQAIDHLYGMLTPK